MRALVNYFFGLHLFQKTMIRLILFINRYYGLAVARFTRLISLKQISFFTVLIVFSCLSCTQTEKEYKQGPAVIVKKEYSLIPGVCTYTYEGYGRLETFEDKCSKFEVGDTLKGSNNKDTTKKE